MNLIVQSEDIGSDIARTLTGELDTDLAARYDGNEDGNNFYEQDLTVPRSTFVVARVEGEAVGCGAIRPMEDERVGEIKRMYVRPAWRGHGVGRRMLVHLEAFAGEMGYEALQLQTGILQPEAIGLYERAGFTRIPGYGTYEDDEWSICFEKRL